MGYMMDKSVISDTIIAQAYSQDQTILMKYHSLFVIFENRQNLKLSSANYRWCFMGYTVDKSVTSDTIIAQSVTSDTVIAQAYSQDTQNSASFVIICPWPPINDRGYT